MLTETGSHNRRVYGAAVHRLLRIHAVCIEAIPDIETGIHRMTPPR